MKFPQFVQYGDSIGVTAPSNGVCDELKIKRIKNATLNMRNAGYTIVTTDNVFTCDERGVSSSGQDRARQFMNLIKNDSVKAIYSVAGGDYLMEMLQYLDWDLIKEHPTWFQGYSDNTGLVYPLVTKCDIAAIYGSGYADFGMKPWHQSVIDAHQLVTGTKKRFESYDYYEDQRYDYVTGYEGYHEDLPVKWINARGDQKIDIEGRVIGGCLDVIVFLLGTKYDGGRDFVQKYAEDGIIWALETFNMEDVVIITHLWQMKEMGYFENVKGFVFGRPAMYNSFSGQDFKDAIMEALGDLEVPIIFEADIGHKGPTIPIIMGSKVRIISEDGSGVIEYI